MKKLLLSFIFLALIAGVPVCYAKKKIPDPLYLNSDTLDYEQIEQKPEKVKDPRTLKEKTRANRTYKEKQTFQTVQGEHASNMKQHQM